MATVAIRRLRLSKLDVDVVLGGGVFRNGWEAFLERIEAGIHAVAPDATVHVLDAPPVVGAAVIGLERLTAPPAAHRRVRAGLTDARITAKTAAGRDRSRARRREES
jgi:hypothetical protein